MDFDFTGQDEVLESSSNEGLLSTSILNLNKKENSSKEFDLSGQEDLFPKKRESLNKPKGNVTSKFGNRIDPFKKTIKFHNGIDIPMQLNTPVNSLGKGTVISTGNSGSKDYGKFVDVDYGGGIVIKYGHLNNIQVEVGDKISPEAIIGLSGSTGRSKGPHLHLKATLNGKPVDPQTLFSQHEIAIGALSNEDVVSDKKFDFSGQEDIVLSEKDIEGFDLSGQDQIGEVKEIGDLPFEKNRTLEEGASEGAIQKFGTRPVVTVPNPHKLVSNDISITINAPTINAIDKNKAMDQWLGAIDPSYSQINSEYRSMSGRNLIEWEVPTDKPLFKNIGNGQYQLTSKLQSGAKDIINAYIQGRNKGGPEAGWESAYLKSQDLKRQHQKVIEEVNNYKANEAENYAKKHPYLNALTEVASRLIIPGADVNLKTIDVGSAVASTLQGNARLSHNLRTLPYAIYMLERYGGDSPEYQAALEKDEEISRNLETNVGEIYQPKDTKGKITKGIVEGIAFLPKAWAVAPLGSAGLPLLVYIENIHRGNREATKSALAMALMSGSNHGLNEFITSGSKIYSHFQLKDGTWATGFEEVGRSLGNRAPFVKLPFELKNLSLKQEINSAFISGEPTTIGAISPLERQLLLRGSNALTSAGGTALEGAGIEDTFSSLMIGLTFPIGKYKVGTFSEGKLNVAPSVDSPSREYLKLVEASRPNIETNIGATTIADQFGKYNIDRSSTLKIDLDTAVLNLLDLKRSLTDKNFIGTGKVGLQESIKRQQAIQKAIGIYEKQIPKETIEFFEKNEGSIRAALKTNYDSIKAKEEYLGQVRETKEHQTLEDIRDNPSLDLKETPISRLQKGIALVKGKENNPQLVREAALDTFGNMGSQNQWQTPDKILFTYDRVLNPKGDSSKFHSNPLVEGSKVLWDLTQIAAFHLEDFYHRGIKPSVSELSNRLRLTIGDLIKFEDKDFQKLFEKGNEYLQGNIADPFFSRLKQDAVEKLPNRFTEEQARNVLSQHKDEFEWTVGLEDFLKENKDKKISKNELVDIIQKGQVRVEASVANDSYLTEENDPIYLRLLDEQGEILKDKYDSKKNELRSEEDFAAIDAQQRDVETRIWSRLDEITAINETNRTKYSLKAHTGEKLELPGAKNSKEIKLITPLERTALNDQVAFEQHLMQKYNLPYNELRGTDSYVISVEDKLKLKELTSLNLDQYKTLYKAPHWDEPNVVAHYRSNDRTTTDNIPIYHSEEFQSDWNHDIRERGVKLTEQQLREYAKNNVIKTDTSVYLDSFKVLNSTLGVTGFGQTREAAIQDYVTNGRRSVGNIEPNPFMQHSWKELVMKRFIRDAVVAKDENGNYKYQGVSWTTARQQMERYGKILEGKDFNWRKNSDGTYTFGLKQEGSDTHVHHHELQNISLERFAELTTKEAADFVREQEANYSTLNEVNPEQTGYMPSGKFNLAEAVNIRKEGSDKYSDYDIALVNIAKKIGKRFGASYSLKEIETEPKYYLEAKYDNTTNKWHVLEVGTNKDVAEFSSKEEAQAFRRANLKSEKVHFLEITPSMRSSLEKEGLPLYGLGGSEPLKYSEQGVRNKIVNTDAFNQARESLVSNLEKQSSDSSSNVLNSGLNPNAFIDQVKLLYKGYKDLTSFSKALVERYGESIRQFTEDLWFQVKGISSEFNDKFNAPIDNWQDNLNKVSNDPSWQIRQGEHGKFSLKKKKSPELEDYFNDPEKHQSLFDKRGLLRGVALSQISTEFGKVYDSLRLANRVVNSYESNVINQLLLAKKLHKVGLDQAVADAIYDGNEGKKTYSVAELTARGLNTAQIEGYKNVRAAIDNVLNLRFETTMYGFRAKADALNNDLLIKVPGSVEYIDIQTKLVDLNDQMVKVGKHYQELKDTGYISLQRTGNVAAYLDDPNYPIGDSRRKIYNQFENEKEANEWLQAQKAALGIASATNWGSIYDIRNLREIAFKEKLTPSQFEDLIDRANVTGTDPEIEKLRTEVYSKFPSYTYQLQREFVRGYDRDLQTAIESITKQLGLYSSSFYTKVGSEEGLKALEATGIEKTDPNLYKIASAYIRDETKGYDISKLGRLAINARRATYFWQLGFDINQLWLNAVAQPITQTYPYFARISYEGKRLTGLEPEHYFLKAGKLTSKALAGDSGDPIFNSIRQQLINEHVLSPEFTRTLIEAKTKGLKKSPVETLEHWGSVFMREGEKVTRTHAAAEAYLVGSEKFGLGGDDLVKFIVKAVDATQSNPTRGENPYYIRSLGEGGKLVYQFMAFNQMWWENLAIGIKQTKGSQRAGFVGREMFPLMLMGGITGMPLYGFASTIYTLLTGNDPKNDLAKLTKQEKDSLLEQFALYGFTTSEGMSQKLTPSVPILDQAGNILNADLNGGVSKLTQQVPVFATADQIVLGVKDLLTKKKRLRGLEGLAPRAIRGPIKTFDYNRNGIKTRGGETIVSRKRLTPLQKAGVAVNIQPTKVGEFYEEKKVKKLKKIRRSLKRLF